MTNLNYHREIAIDIYQDNVVMQNSTKVKTVHTIVFEHEDNDAKAEAVLLKWYGWTKGVHYARFKTRVIKEEGTKIGLQESKEIKLTEIYQEPNSSPAYLRKKHQEEMAKKQETAEQTEQTGVVVFEETAAKINLPDIPKVMTIGGVEFSEEAIKKEVAEAKKITVEIPLDTDTVEVAKAKKANYETMVKKKNQFVKTRTAPDKFRQSVMKPINDWSKKLKAQTDAYGTLAKEGEEHCIKQIEVFDNWEAEQERLRLEAEQILIDKRTVDLQSVQGLINRESLHWTFEHMPSKIVENKDILAMDDSEWNGLMKELEDSVDAAAKKKAQQEAEFEASKNAVFNARVQMLQLMQYQPEGENFTKNGHMVTPDIIRATAEADWFALIQSHNEPKAAPSNPFAAPPAQAQQQPATPSPSTNNPFATFAAAFATPQTTESLKEVPVDISAENTQSTVIALPTVTWDVPFVEKTLGNTTLRIFHRDTQEQAIQNIGEIKFDGAFENGLMFIIHKPNA